MRSVDEVAAVAVACQLPGKIELSRRQQQLVRLICKDKSVAAEMKIANSTFETHPQNIRKRIGVSGTGRALDGTMIVRTYIEGCGDAGSSTTMTSRRQH